VGAERLSTGNGYRRFFSRRTLGSASLLADPEEADMATEPHREPSTVFGAELRRRRMAAGLSLGNLAKKAHYTKGYLSRVENGHQMPSLSLARQCDALLEANGELTSLVPAKTTSLTTYTSADSDDSLWVLELRRDGGNMFHPLRRREMITLGIASLAGVRLAASPPQSGNALREYRTLFEHTRQIGQTNSPALVLPLVIAQAHALRCLLSGATAKERTELALLAARNAEYAGWMAQEAGDVDAARWWTRKSVEIAAEVGDENLAAYSLVRYALVAMYRGDAGSTIELAQGAQKDSGIAPRIRGLAAQREGQGYALAGDHIHCMRALDRASDLLTAAAEQGSQSQGPVIGTSFVDDPVAVVKGWCLHDLGRPAEAADVLDREVARIPRSARRSWSRFTARQALAHATAGNVDQACALARQLVETLRQIDSDTVRSDVRSLAAVLRRWHNHGAVREVHPMLTDALRRPA
jgi:transcriptional regulator with XRE-family HTH domain